MRDQSDLGEAAIIEPKFREWYEKMSAKYDIIPRSGSLDAIQRRRLSIKAMPRPSKFARRPFLIPFK